MKYPTGEGYQIHMDWFLNHSSSMSGTGAQLWETDEMDRIDEIKGLTNYEGEQGSNDSMA